MINFIFRILKPCKGFFRKTGLYLLTFSTLFSLFPVGIITAKPVTFNLLYATPPRFLTLPFYKDLVHPIIMGDTWIRNNGSSHQGVDYFRGDWNSFTILAAADGQAMYVPNHCTWGNYIKIKHLVNGEIWYTLYAHLASSNIPADGTFHTVAGGSVIGTAGKTGYWKKNSDGTCDTTQPYSVIHLHFELSKDNIGSPNRVDPYGVYSYEDSGLYPGESIAYTTNPPSYPGAITPPSCSAPSNGVPRDNSVINTNQVTFSWSPSTCDGLDYYTFRVSNHADIDNPPWIIDHGVNKDSTSNTETIPSEYNGQTLYWSIWAHNSAGYSQKGGPWLFKVDTSVTPPPSPLPTGVWNVQYFRNKELTDQCSTTTMDRTFIFNDWGEGAPASGCNTDNWGARFTRRVHFDGGGYTFGLKADDWGRIYVNNDLVVNKWDGASQVYESRNLPAGDYDIRIEFADTMGNAKIYAWWWGPGIDVPHQTQDTNQWFSNYWLNPDLWEDSFAKVNEGTGTLDHQWDYSGPGWDMPSDNFSATFQRTAYFDCGTYRFMLNHDDGARFWLDNQLKLDRWTGTIGYTEISLPITRGNHTVQIDYRENGGAAHVSFDWDQISTCTPFAPVLQSPSDSIDLDWNTDLTLAWNSTSGATQYFAQLTGGPGVDINSGWISGTQWYIGGLWPGVYSWSVTARNDSGSSEPSETRTFTVLDPPIEPPSGNLRVFLPSIIKSQAGQWVTIMSEGFEGVFPGNWTILDAATQSSGIGYQWKDRSCVSSAGSWSGWAVGGGSNGLQLSCGSNYPNDASTWMIYGPFDLSNATSAELRFQLWLNSETNYDYFRWGASTDGYAFRMNDASGNSNGWVSKVENFNSFDGINYLGQNQVWIGFLFTSDSSIYKPNGVFIDEILLRKCVGGTCN